MSNAEVESRELTKLRELLLAQLGLDITPAGSLALQQGILDGFEKLASKLSMEALDDIKRQLGQCIKADWENVWQNGLNQCKPSFIQAVLDIYRNLKR